MFPPVRKRKKPYRPDELLWYRNHGYDSEDFEEDEFDIPSLDKLDEKIEKDFRLIDNDSHNYKIKPGSIIPMIIKFFDYVDELNIIYSKYCPCKKGCKMCCYIPIGISDLEVIMIKNYFDKNKRAYKQTKPKKEIPKNATSEMLIGEQYRGQKCPFLKDDICSIYPVRPFKCRGHLVLEDTVEKCGQYGASLYSVGLGYSIERTYYEIISYHHKKHGQNISSLPNFMVFSDIRENFMDIDVDFNMPIEKEG
jgi:Fe-S-cluster containining protein